MEKTWYLFPGQTLRNTKVVDRGKALVFYPEGWQKMQHHLNREKIQREIIEQERAHKQAIKDASYAITKNWDDSVEKIQQRRMEAHEIKRKAREDDLFKRFVELRQEQAEERAKYVEKERKRIYMHQDKSRHLNSALMLSETLYEVNLQLEFNKLLQEHERIEDLKEGQLLKLNAEIEVEENKEKRRKRREKDTNNCNELLAQIKEKQDAEKKAQETKTNAEIEDNKKAFEEFKDITAYEKKLKEEKKADVRRQFYQFAEVQKKIKEETQKQDEIADKIINVYTKAKCKIDEKRKNREKEILAEMVRIKERISEKVAAQQQNTEEEEKKRLQAAVEEYEEKLRKREEADAAYKKRLIKERQEYYDQVALERQQQKKIKEEIEKYEMINRFKTNEVVKKVDQAKAQRLFDEKILHRKELFEQINDKDAKKLKEVEEKKQEFERYKERLANDDKAFFAYADEVLDLAKSRGRTTEPILKVIQKYKNEHNLEPKKIVIPREKLNNPKTGNKQSNNTQARK